MKQNYQVISGQLKLVVSDEEIILNPGETHVVKPGQVHWAESVGDKECWVEIYSEPGWTEEDHIVVEADSDN